MKPNPKAGRPRSKASPAKAKAIRRLKSSLNPATGKLWTYREIGRKLGISGPAAAYYLKGDKGCPCCKQIVKVRG